MRARPRPSPPPLPPPLPPAPPPAPARRPAQCARRRAVHAAARGDAGRGCRSVTVVKQARAPPYCSPYRAPYCSLHPMAPQPRARGEAGGGRAVGNCPSPLSPSKTPPQTVRPPPARRPPAARPPPARTPPARPRGRVTPPPPPHAQGWRRWRRRRRRRARARRHAGRADGGLAPREAPRPRGPPACGATRPPPRAKTSPAAPTAPQPPPHALTRAVRRRRAGAALCRRRAERAGRRPARGRRGANPWSRWLVSWAAGLRAGGRSRRGLP